jgi:O-acetyl-ADP-ribose deacetylase (regulator of RNase III)
MVKSANGRRHSDGSIDYDYYRRRASRWRRRVLRILVARGLCRIGQAMRIFTGISKARWLIFRRSP